MSDPGFAPHDHSACVADAVARVDRRCREAGLRLTPVRRRVLELLLAEHRAHGAYDILDQLRAEGLGSQPPVAYRALDFLVEHGFAHRVERLNAFVACARTGHDHSPAFLICRQCRRVAETETAALRDALARTAAGAGFTVERVAVEAEGLCPACAAAAPDPANGASS